MKNFLHKFFYSAVLLPAQPTVSVLSIEATSISLSWSVPSDSVVASSEVVWGVAISSGGGDGTRERTSGSLNGNSYTLESLESDSLYTIIIILSNVAGSTDSQPIFVSTGIEPAHDYNIHAWAYIWLSCPFSTVPDVSSCHTTAMIGGVMVAVTFIVAVAVTIIVIVLKHRCNTEYAIDHKYNMHVTCFNYLQEGLYRTSLQVLRR